MFKAGDKIVYIIDDNFKYPYTLDKFILDKVYTFNKYSEINYKYLIVEEHSYLLVPYENFISLKEYRKQKLKKLNESRRQIPL